MPWSARAHTTLPLIEIIYAGRVTPAELKDAVRSVARLIHETGRKLILTDCTDLAGGHSILDLYELVEDMARIPEARGIQEAVIMAHEAALSEEVRFWEIASRNRGIIVRTFAERTAAVNWLLG